LQTVILILRQIILVTVILNQQQCNENVFVIHKAPSVQYPHDGKVKVKLSLCLIIMP